MNVNDQRRTDLRRNVELIQHLANALKPSPYETVLMAAWRVVRRVEELEVQVRELSGCVAVLKDRLAGRDVPKPNQPPQGTCDWGGCDLRASSWREWRDGVRRVWLPVCDEHETAPDLRVVEPEKA